MSESIAAGLAVEAMKALTKVVTGRAMKEITLFWGFQKDLEKLKNRLLDIQAFLEDLNNGKQQLKELNRVNRWLQQIKEVAYLADNVMDDYSYEMLRRKIEFKTNNKPALFKRKWPKFFTKTNTDTNTNTNRMLFRFRMSHRVRKILSKFDELDKEAKHIGLQQLACPKLTYTTSFSNKNADLNQTREHAAARGLDFIGRRQDEFYLLRILLDPSLQRDLPIIAIVGIGGLGKTTLARHVFEHRRVDGHFEKNKVWICVSNNFNVERILKEMVEALTSSACNFANTGAIVNKLKGEVQKKFLLVLDDVWNENTELWDSLKNGFYGIGVLTGSVILITTRSIEVASKARAIYSYMLPGLSESDGWALLNHTRSETNQSFPHFEDVGKRIVKKCKGVPLAIKAIRGLLASKEHLYEWEEIERNELWNWVSPTVFPSLMLSYNHLNSASLKQCFAFCAVFPKDRLIEKDELIALWMSQGFLDDEPETRDSNLTMEMIGEKYVTMLVNCSFLQESRKGDQFGYIMHDLVHDLATCIAKKDLGVWKEDNDLDCASSVRHLVFNREDIEKEPQNLVVQKLRTLSFWVSSVPRWDSLICARYLRTLILANIGLENVPYVVGELVHLRYLDLSNNKEIEELPESLCRLSATNTETHEL